MNCRFRQNKVVRWNIGVGKISIGRVVRVLGKSRLNTTYIGYDFLTESLLQMLYQVPGSFLTKIKEEPDQTWQTSNYLPMPDKERMPKYHDC